MNTLTKISLSLLTITATYGIADAQQIKMGDLITICNAKLKKDVKPDTFQAYFTKEFAPSWNKDKPGESIHLLMADRGDRKGDFLLVCRNNPADRKANSHRSPFADTRLSEFLSKPDSYTQYQLIGAEKFDSMRSVGILGIHYIKVKPGRSKEFEKFVVEKLHPAVGQLLPDMQLLYYKAVAGENLGSYITIFAIESIGARDKYWPTGAPETELLKQAFRPLNNLAVELGPYLVEGSYLEPPAGAAAYFESKEWTDFVNQGL